jgi:alpha-galactosidase
VAWSSSDGHRSVALEAAGVLLVLDLPGGLLPEVLHWGAPVPGLSAQEVQSLVAAAVPLRGNNDVDAPARVAVLPEHATG